MAANLFYAQSGGVTAVINATACGVIQAAREQGGRIGKVFAGRNGILGALHEDLIDTSFESDSAIAALRHTPGGAFGSCRYKLKGLDESRAHYERLIDVFRAHDIRYFLYNGGNDSMDTAWKVSQIAERLNYPLVCVGVPKTVDNDLVGTDNCPGFGSVAKYVAVSMMEAGLDVASMARTSTKIFVMEVMGRHAGWITAAAGLAARNAGDAPHLLLFPEIPFDQAAFMARVDACVREHQFCAIAVSEGLRGPDGKLLAESGTRDAFGHAQLGGVGQQVAELIKAQLGHKYHWALPDYLQRSGRHIASATDAAQAHALGRRAVELALEGRNAVMPAIVRTADSPYQWEIGVAQLADVVNHEKMMPRDFISDDGFSITDACRRYLQPLIAGEDYPPYVDGLPAYVSLKNESVAAVLPAFGG
ncbi:6-phosphofructokinase [Methyloversatilis sp. XJ19-13]|uniref:6-phosphofructokinase n=1 Tax=Methyloversatilis sp. XJ19-13 TaxID=2963430 RepID=UPI00211C8BC4|nr:6-phosphofructokinase [Methyloversatilis sp. XJ19-13]MCQ9374173.1 6-phosphofructokinase [Methyloversatilis sp. XJ19-13]